MVLKLERIDKVLSNSDSFLGFCRSSKYQQSQAGRMNEYFLYPQTRKVLRALQFHQFENSSKELLMELRA